MKPDPLHIERCNYGEAIIAPSQNWWETGVTFNPAAVYLDRSPTNDLIIKTILPMRTLDDPDLADGIVAVHYRARPETDPGSPFVRSFIGLAIFTPALNLLYRFQEPVMYPSADPKAIDTLGVEDPRITRIGDVFYMVYCGLATDPLHIYKAALCMATSTDLLHWKKLGKIPGDIHQHDNKDGVLFPEPVNGKYYLLHRPFGENVTSAEKGIRLAAGKKPEGPYTDCGELLHAFVNPRMQDSWLGAGSVPIPMGGGRYALIYHTGNIPYTDKTEYDLDAALMDFNLLDPQHPSTAITGRIEHLMTPETPEELRSLSALQVANVLFACGSYVYRDDIYIIYGGADTYTLAARVNKQEFFTELEGADLVNPFQSGE